MGLHLALTLLLLYIETCSTTFYRVGICVLKQSPALISMPPGSTLALRGCFRIFVAYLLVKNIYKEPTSSMPGFAFQRMDFCFHPTFAMS
jgi:hypothetical protein